MNIVRQATGTFKISVALAMGLYINSLTQFHDRKNHFFFCEE